MPLTELTPAPSFVMGKSGNWHRLASGRVVLWCYHCEGLVFVTPYHDHGVDREGRVTPSVRCQDCGWVALVRLAGWAGSE